MTTYVLRTLVGLLIVTPCLIGQTTAPSPGEQLRQLTAQLQQSPGDQALREKIIALALTLNPKPATPDAVTMAEGAAEYAFKNAKSNSDYSDAAKQYEKALLLAPWLADDYFNCGVAHEKAGENKEAVRSFELYLLAAPNAADAQPIKKRIGGLQYVAQKADNAANEEARALARQAALQQEIAVQLAAAYQGLEGGMWRLVQNGTTMDGAYFRSGDLVGQCYIVVKDHEIKEYDAKHFVNWETAFSSRVFKMSVPNAWGVTGVRTVTISNDGRTVTAVLTFRIEGRNFIRTDIFRRE